MKLLFDQNLSAKLVARLNDLFPDSTHVRLEGLATASDLDVWRFSEAQGYIIVSLDADFADLAALLGAPPKVVWLRCGNRPTGDVEALLRQHADAVRGLERDPQIRCLEIRE